jgi:hypothetical protein
LVQRDGLRPTTQLVLDATFVCYADPMQQEAGGHQQVKTAVGAELYEESMVA